MVVISGPDVFEKAVIPYLKSEVDKNVNFATADPLDEAMKHYFKLFAQVCLAHVAHNLCGLKLKIVIRKRLIEMKLDYTAFRNSSSICHFEVLNESGYRMSFTTQ